MNYNNPAVYLEKAWGNSGSKKAAALNHGFLALSVHVFQVQVLKFSPRNQKHVW